MIRFSINISPELRKRLNKLPWGVRGEASRIMLEMLCTLHESYGNSIIGGILSQDMKISMRDEPRSVTKGDRSKRHKKDIENANA